MFLVPMIVYTDHDDCEKKDLLSQMCYVYVVIIKSKICVGKLPNAKLFG